ncbi:529_t:CDS:1, partial [Racocetra fulgida]
LKGEVAVGCQNLSFIVFAIFLIASGDIVPPCSSTDINRCRLKYLCI